MLINYLRNVLGHLDDLADLIEIAQKNYSIYLPTTILTVLRAILFMFNGDAAECVEISVDGYTEKKYVFAQSATWNGVSAFTSVAYMAM